MLFERDKDDDWMKDKLKNLIVSDDHFMQIWISMNLYAKKKKDNKKFCKRSLSSKIRALKLLW